MKCWSEFKGELPARLPCDEKYTVVGSEHVRLERQRAVVFEALARATDDQSSPLGFFIHPSEVRTTEKVAKGKLCLVPFTDLKGIHTKKTPGSNVIVANVGSDALYLMEPARARTKKADEWAVDVLFVAYWWVGTTHNKDDANMVEKAAKDKDSNVSYTTLVNNRQLAPHEVLLSYKPKTKVVPLSSVASLSKKRRSA